MWPTNSTTEGDDMRINHNKTHRRSTSSGFSVAISFLLSIIVLVGLICFLEKVQCVIQQQAEQSSSSGGGEQNSLVNNDIGNNNQETFRTGRSIGNSYSAIVDGVEGGNNAFMGWARGAYANNNNKRARKMSAFMPMRGRKDGRDEVRSDTVGSDLDGNPMADTNRGDSDSVHDWITSSTVSPSSFWVSSSNDGGLQAMGQQRFVGTPVPIQFANQLAAHRMQQQQQQQRTSMLQQHSPIDSMVLNGGGGVATASGDAMSSPGGQLTILTPAGFSNADLISGSPAAGVMPVKLRRAFHPMRGKKWAGNGNFNGLDQNDEFDMMSM